MYSRSLVGLKVLVSTQGNICFLVGLCSARQPAVLAARAK